MSVRRRPIGVTIIGILFFLAGLIFLFAGVAGFTSDDETIMAAGAGSLIVGLIYLLLAFGCFKGWGWVWTLAVVFTIIGIIITLVTAFSAGLDGTAFMAALIALIIPLIILLYLFSNKVKVWFGKA